ncbi:MAG: hypothetical protein AAB392_01385 [Patescibacteria group bacterium]
MSKINKKFVFLGVFLLVTSFALPINFSRASEEVALVEPLVEEVVIGEIIDGASTEFVEETVIEESVVEVTAPTEVLSASMEEPQTLTISEPILTPTLTTDKADYHPGETATIFGKFFAPLQNFILKIFGSDENDQNYTEQVETVTTNETGFFSFNYTLDNLYRPFYEVIVSTLSGDKVAETWFRDSSVQIYDQCTNDDGDGYATGDTECRWTNGAINSSNSVYFEGDSTIHRTWIKGFAPDTQHTVTFKYGTTKGGKHAYDYLTTFDASEDSTEADRCDDITGCVGADEVTSSMQNDPNVPDTIELALGTRNFTLRGGTIDVVSVPLRVSGATTTDSETVVTVTFTTAATGTPMCEESNGPKNTTIVSCGIAIWFGAHIANSSEWFDFDGTTGAGSINGSPYHVALASVDNVDATQGGGRDNQMSADVLVVPTQATLTLLKTVVNDNGGTAVDTNWTLSANGPTPISGTEGQTAITNALVDAGAYTFSESSGPAGYTASLYSCVINGGNPIVSNSLTLAPDDIAVCTITNNDQQAFITVNKVVINNNGGTKGVADFALKLDGNAVTSGVPVPINPGTYIASEDFATAVGYSLTGFTGDCDGSGNITVALGESKTCTLTNDDQSGNLIVHKVTVPGTDTTTQFSVTLNSTPVNFGGNATQNIVGGGIVNYEVNAGTYSVTEAPQAGWTQTSNTCSNIVIPNGGFQHCYITNTQKGNIIIVKDVIGNPDPTDFTFTNNFGNGNPASFMLDEDGNGDLPSSRNFEVLPGTYSVAETALPHWQLESATCSDQSPVNAIVVSPGEIVTCTFVNEELNKITLIKNTVGSDGTFDFTMTGDTLAPSAELTTVAGTKTQVFEDIDQDNEYTISETVPAGWVLTSATCTGDESPESITPEPGEDVTCTFTNTKLPTLTLQKTVIKDNGGSALDTDWTLSANGPTPISGIEGNANVTNKIVSIGSYDLSETNGPTGYTPSAWVCTGGSQNDGDTVTLAAGQNVTCVITNDDIAPKLHLRKVVVNDNGGLADEADFTLTADGTGANDIFGTSPVDSGAGLLADTFALSETPLAGYTASAWVCVGGTQSGSNITVGIGGEATCTITNDDQQAYIRVVKVVNNDNGGNALPNDFALTLEGNAVTSGTSNPVNPGTYTASETLVAGYSFSGFSGDCDQNSDTTVALGQTKTCTLTNDDVVPKLHLRKIVINDNGGTALDTAWTLTADGALTNDLVGSTPVDSTGTLKADTFALSESGPAGYTASAWTCVGGTQNGSNITVGIGGEATCTITNDDIAPKLHLRKVVINNNGGTATVADFLLSANGTDTNDISGTSPVDSDSSLKADTWALSETPLAGYTASDWSCVGGTQNGSNITVGIGDEATCTITNDDQQAYITVVKNIVNDNDGPITNPNAFNLTFNGTPTLSGVAIPVNPGTYTAGETSLPGYIFEGFTGDCNTAGATTVALGENKTCTLTNNDTPGHFTGGGSIFVEALKTGTKKPGDGRVTHGFTLHCDKNRLPNRLEVNWAGLAGAKGKYAENNFHLTSLDTASCSDTPNIDSGKPNADFDTITGTGTGRFNGVDGATVSFVFTDAGEPGRNDTAQMIITPFGSGTPVLNISGALMLNFGNQQAHQDN